MIGSAIRWFFLALALTFLGGAIVFYATTIVILVLRLYGIIE
jgi:Na+-transporting methylmalonyl-CoA/oxaloacetate decarboxylase gamma subunit